MRIPLLIFFVFLLPLMAIAQTGEITGKVRITGTQTPIDQANVFLSNSTSGTSTRSDGSFDLSGLKPGQYTLVVSIVGYDTYTKSVLVGAQPIHLDIELSQSNTQLHEVVITTPADWKRNYEEFVKVFIGTDENAKYCTVLNPHIVTLQYHKSTQVLEAYTDDFLVVENLGLGYRVKFLLKSFEYDKLNGVIHYEGQQLFSELKGSKKQEEIWHKNRRDTYYGSHMHFYRALYQDKLDSEGFIMMKYTRELNPARPSEKVIQQKLKKFNDGTAMHHDSAVYWVGIAKMSKYYKESLDRKPIPAEEIVQPTNQKGVYVVNFKGYNLYVVYTKKREQTDFADMYRPLDMPNYQTSVVSVTEPYVFDDNGVVFGESGPLYEGTWSKSRLSDLLPVNYVPDGPVVPDKDE
jgi:hypothetical protein